MKKILISITLMLLTACGGGGSDDVEVPKPAPISGDNGNDNDDNSVIGQMQVPSDFDFTTDIELFIEIRDNLVYKKAFLIVGFENGKDIAQDLPDLYRPFDCIDCTETKIRHSMPAKILFNLYKPKDKVINYNNSPIDNIQNRTKNLKSNDILVILGSHYFGPHIKRIFKNCFDIKLKQ